MNSQDSCEICGENLRWHDDDGYCGDDFYSAANFNELIAGLEEGLDTPEDHMLLLDLSFLRAIHDRLRDDITYYEYIMEHEGIE